MSTRCQVQLVEGEGKNSWEKVTLYHHCDGYPSHMIPTFQKAFEMISTPKEGIGGPYSHQWHAGRAGKSASYLCAIEPGQYEPEAGHDLHGDIEWYYRIFCTGDRWQVEVYTAGWDCTPEDLHLVHPRIDVMEVTDELIKKMD